MTKRHIIVSLLFAACLLVPAGCKPDRAEDEPGGKEDPAPSPDPGTDPEEGAKSFTFRLMTFNILQSKDEAEGHQWADFREAPCKTMLSETDPDIICFQECRRTQLNFIKTNFPKYSYYVYAKDGVKKAGYEAVERCEDEIFKNGGQRNVIALRKDSFEMVSWGRYWYSETPDESSYKGADFEDGGTPKLTLWLKVREKKTGIEFYVWDTHFFPHGDLGRRQCGIMSVERMKKECGEDAVVFFCGDLNRAYEHDDLTPLRNWMSHARKAARISDNSPTYTGFRTDQNTWTWIDHIFFRNASATRYVVVSQPVADGTSVVSDHFPVYTDFEVAQK